MELSSTLRNLVSQSVACLGESIADCFGVKLYQQVESLRLEMKEVRGDQGLELAHKLNQNYQKMNQLSTEQLHQLSKSYSLMLELMNACESAYRAYRLRGYKIEPGLMVESLIYVFTGHPTEARSKTFLMLMDQVTRLLEKSLDSDFEEIRIELTYLLKLALQINFANDKKPKVKDEIKQVFHTVLKDEVLKEQIDQKKKGLSIFFRTWVGGDKDGHPGVDEKSSVESWQSSRSVILNYAQRLIKNEIRDQRLLGQKNSYLIKLQQKAMALREVKAGDGKRVEQFGQFLADADENYYWLSQLKVLLELYPALLIPLELREDSEVIACALSDKKTYAIERMFKMLAKVSKGSNPKSYARALVVSMCQQGKDLFNGHQLVAKYLNELIPVVPLLENEKGLKNALEILAYADQKIKIFKMHRKNWRSRFEVMLGYSDSSKENGVLVGRTMVEKALHEISEYLLKQKITPVFFHGSGGSVSRGGGSIQEQIAWWPKSALNNFKVTIQGESIQRNFEHRRFIRSQSGKIIHAFRNSKEKRVSDYSELQKFLKEVQDSYRKLVNSGDFQNLVQKTTPYDYLNLLKIGSRPTKRAKTGAFSLRAIPWILCWTQTRLLLPVWWGVGSSWSHLKLVEKNKIKDSFQSSDLLTSYLKQLGFTLAKVELGVWLFLLDKSDLEDDEKEFWAQRLAKELESVKDFFSFVSQEQNYTWYRPSLGQSIYLRSSMIHPLNIIQKIAIERKDHALLRETVTGIACGMLTTG